MHTYKIFIDSALIFVYSLQASTRVKTTRSSALTIKEGICFFGHAFLGYGNRHIVVGNNPFSKVSDCRLHILHRNVFVIANQPVIGENQLGEILESRLHIFD